MQTNTSPWLLTVFLPWLTYNPYEYHVVYFVQWFWESPDAAEFLRSITDREIEKLIAAAIAIGWGLFLIFIFQALLGEKWDRTAKLAFWSYIPLVLITSAFGIFDFSSNEVRINALMLGIGWMLGLARWRIAVASGVGVMTIRQ